jgi:NADP-dependent 3-hydroxy acid dehydrogenase YdfG
LIASKPTQRLIATARKPSDLSYLPDGNANILKLALDVTSATSVDAAFNAAAERKSLQLLYPISHCLITFS